MSRYDFYNYFPPSKPLETDEGIKATSKRGAFVENWWADRWIEAMESITPVGRLRRGRRYARRGQVLSIDETRDGIQAKVQGSTSRPYTVTIEVSPLSDTEWEQVITILAGQAIFSAQLLAGEMPPEIESAFEAAGVSLFPRDEAELITDCSCPDWSNPCKHVAAVHYILGERFDQDPFFLFRLRGRSQEAILAALRERRGAGAAAEADEEPEPTIPLDETLDSFWEGNRSLSQFQTTIRPPRTELPILKRLGQPAFLAESLEAMLGPSYLAISDHAIAAAFNQNRDDTTVEGPDEDS